MADLASSPYFLLILFIAAFALPLVYLVWIRNSPRYGRKPWPTVLQTFAWRAVFGVIIAIMPSDAFIRLLVQIQSLNDFVARRLQDPTSALRSDTAGAAVAFLAAVSLAIVAISVVRLKLVSRRSPTSR